MNAKKQKIKDRRRARKLAEQAWEAVDAGNLDLAEKIVRRAVAAQIDNPVLWVDQGLILGLRGKEAESADAFRAAIGLTPTFAEPYAHLAALRFRQGFSAEAVALQTQAVKHAPDDAAKGERLAAYQAVADSERPRAFLPSPGFAGEGMGVRALAERTGVRALSPPLPLWERGPGGEGERYPSPHPLSRKAGRGGKSTIGTGSPTG
jgi:tetratricopeptide (TPR) repeat protein